MAGQAVGGRVEASGLAPVVGRAEVESGLVLGCSPVVADPVVVSLAADLAVADRQAVVGPVVVASLVVADLVAVSLVAADPAVSGSRVVVGLVAVVSLVAVGQVAAHPRGVDLTEVAEAITTSGCLRSACGGTASAVPPFSPAKIPPPRQLLST